MKKYLIKLNDIIRLPEEIPCDKRIHMLVGMFITSILLCFIHVVYVLAIVTIVAWGVEVYQGVTKYGTYDNMDAVSALIGSVIVAVPWIIRMC